MTDNQSEQGTHFWFMSLQRPNRNPDWAKGTLTPATGATRLDVFESLHAWMIEENPELANAAVLAFDIQPNQL